MIISDYLSGLAVDSFQTSTKASHYLCISCLASVAQLKRQMPKIQIEAPKASASFVVLDVVNECFEMYMLWIVMDRAECYHCILFLSNMQ